MQQIRRNRTTNQKPRNFAHDQLKNPAQGYPKEKIKKIKSVHSGYRDLAIWIKGIQYQSLQLRYKLLRL